MPKAKTWIWNGSPDRGRPAEMLVQDGYGNAPVVVTGLWCSETRSWVRRESGIAIGKRIIGWRPAVH